MKTIVMFILDERDVPYKVKRHSRPVFTSEDAASERGVRLSQIVKTMLVVTRTHDYLVALIPGHCRLSLKRLGSIVNDKHLQFVARDKVKDLTGYQPGAVSP